MTRQRMPTLRVLPDEVSPYALVVGDPERAAQAAGLLEEAREIGSFREFRTFIGMYLGRQITVSSHGVGSSGASVCFHELFRCGVHSVIRAGTCGAMLPEVEDGDLIIGTGAIREDGASEYLAPRSLPAIADWHMTQRWKQLATAWVMDNPIPA